MIRTLNLHHLTVVAPCRLQVGRGFKLRSQGLRQTGHRSGLRAGIFPESKGATEADVEEQKLDAIAGADYNRARTSQPAVDLDARQGE